MKYIKLLMVLAVAVYTLNGCAGKVPDCSSSDTTKLVGQIFKSQLAKAGKTSMLQKIDFEVTNIKTLSYDKDADKYQCSADFKLTNTDNGQTRISPITYVSEKTKDNRQYVTVHGF